MKAVKSKCMSAFCAIVAYHAHALCRPLYPSVCFYICTRHIAYYIFTYYNVAIRTLYISFGCKCVASLPGDSGVIRGRSSACIIVFLSIDEEP